MHYYVNLPVSWVHKSDKWLELFLEQRLNPELGFDEYALELPAAWHRENAKRFLSSGLACAAHLPFFGLLPGQSDAAVRRRGVELLKRAAEIAQFYEAAYLIGHPSFFAHCDAEEQKPLPANLGPLPAPGWLENSLRSWHEVLSATNVPLYLENTYDAGPETLLLLIDGLWSEGYEGRSGMCFDIGHWFSFAQGCVRKNLRGWLDKIAPYLRHLHLHDNIGHNDQHLGLGQGGIPLNEFFTALRERKLYPSFTLEPHDLSSFEHSKTWLACNLQAGEWLEALASNLDGCRNSAAETKN